MLRKFFKLDEPLGRAGFIIGSTLVFVFIFFLDFVFRFSVLSLFFDNLYWFFIIPLSIKRLKDIGKSKNLVWIFLFQTIIFSIFNLPVLKDLPAGVYFFKNIMIIVSYLSSLFLFIYLVLSAGKIAEEEKSAMIINRILLFIIVFGFFAFLIGSCQYEKYADKKAAMKIVAAIDQFEIEKGRYPLTLDELVPDYLDEIPKTKRISFGATNFGYHPNINDEKPGYCIGFIYFPVRHLSYCTDKREWIDWD